MQNIVNFSGGKDSTAMLLRLIEEGHQVDPVEFQVDRDRPRTEVFVREWRE